MLPKISPTIRHTLPDYVALLITFFIGVGVSYIHPFERPFRPDDLDISHPHYNDWVPNGVVISVVLIVPPVVMALFWAVRVGLDRMGWIPLSNVTSPVRPNRGNVASFAKDLHWFMLGLLFSLATTKLFTDFLKNWAGRLRPDFLGRCLWNATLNACTGDTETIREGRRSFPSGHTSSMFAGMGFLSIWMAGWFGVLRNWREREVSVEEDESDGMESAVEEEFGKGWKGVLILVPLLPAFYVGISRTQQYVHHPSDVAFGGAMGFLISLLFYRLFYDRTGRPKSFSIRVPARRLW
ncbi:uncharacterized protein SPPG_06022 [Spizellomyces punctatus DAOM BR117]|uniref:Phosphatidic acid phosphatase type 2/haloperoxidase domain-containing protein n=1 Tax=Spizellomyces punctatus (strain DAOM BR117) TaxID=645134 RepID=A0A0L0HC16_SPIPD|nr:uncharacterized protein SPPG_06022 [Spizellomyces punctatus DAOM BR117]KNC99075.1 hypothetical protein SPPG_06022 [Spizellomyces punctatus DAOM BR117]|eukprot:XP_016607115.1 hypothetical protein SPPG_06022 [Spizellomyces punctatus DAOM BR117]